MYFATTIAEKRITRKEKYTIGEMGEPAEEEKEKMEREYSKTYAKKIYII